MSGKEVLGQHQSITERIIKKFYNEGLPITANAFEYPEGYDSRPFSQIIVFLISPQIPAFDLTKLTEHGHYLLEDFEGMADIEYNAKEVDTRPSHASVAAFKGIAVKLPHLVASEQIGSAMVTREPLDKDTAAIIGSNTLLEKKNETVKIMRTIEVKVFPSKDIASLALDAHRDLLQGFETELSPLIVNLVPIDLYEKHRSMSGKILQFTPRKQLSE